MLTHIIAILSLSVLCGSWVVFQQWLAREDPHNPGIEGRGSCQGSGGSCSCASGYAHCENAEEPPNGGPTKHQLHDVLKSLNSLS